MSVLVTAAALAFVFSGSAVAATYTERATQTSGTPSLEYCNEVRTQEAPIGTQMGLACFQPYGDRFWVKDMRADGYHIEMRAIDSDGKSYRCYEYGTSSAGWQICDSFHDNIGENKRLFWTVGAYDRDKLIMLSSERVSPTS
ncbi:hypothetical protein B1813_03160 [Saccharomonospora piscinae]|uniref:Ig-like domain-containing protein n=1 Tax=Saccharomonospora piscinae TaxID=687388 RepID=A0A1V9ADG1_SACPI|nr:hypothetical protein [Saccharomonospora piscinae]OQO95068.1 hypothetical protein B1813_03160 [Saccharomonospora piscinae]TLW90462.1 hypothetical protein FFT09_21370 [Saccharomonospora piscinae]